MTCHAEFLRNINYVNSTYTITCLLFFTTRRAPTITRNTPNRYSNTTAKQTIPIESTLQDLSTDILALPLLNIGILQRSNLYTRPQTRRTLRRTILYMTRHFTKTPAPTRKLPTHQPSSYFLQKTQTSYSPRLINSTAPEIHYPHRLRMKTTPMTTLLMTPQSTSHIIRT